MAKVYKSRFIFDLLNEKPENTLKTIKILYEEPDDAQTS